MQLLGKRAMSTKEDEMLISLIQNHPLIYNDVCKDIIVDKLWKEISVTMGLSTELCKRKWTNLRNTYARHIRGEKEGVIYDHKPWFLANQMSFLNDYLHNRTNTLDSLNSQLSYTWSPDSSSTSESYRFQKQANIDNGPESLPEVEILSATSIIDSNSVNKNGGKNNQGKSTGKIKAETQEMQINRHTTMTSLMSGKSEDDNNSAEEVDESHRDPSTRTFLRSIMLKYDKLSSKRRRLFQQKMLCGLHELLNEQEDDQHATQWLPNSQLNPEWS